MGAWDYTDETFPSLPKEGIHGDLLRMKAKLESLSFQVTVVENPTSTQAEKAVDAFGAQLKTRGGASLFYFTGHGAEHEGRNYLVPVGETNIVEGADLKEKALAANRVLSRMESSGTEVNLVFLDCCRNQLTKNGGDEGMAPMQAKGTLIGFATRSGDLADTTVQGSPYITALVAHLAAPGLSLTDMHTMVTGELVRSGSARRPGNYSDLDAIYQLVPATLDRAEDGDMQALIERRARELAAKMAPSPLPSIPSSTDPEPGDLTQITLPGGVVMKFCWCPAGSFTMGSPQSEEDRSADEDQVQVRLTQGFWLAQTECTQGQWTALMGSNPSNFKGNDLPVETVSWEDVQSFISKGNQSAALPAGWRLALPTEAQWEYACRAGTESAFSFGAVLNGKQANCDGNYPYGTTTKGTYLQKTCGVASYAANPWGLHDMHGNVWEWCVDALDGTTKLSGGTDPVGSSGAFRVVRGGSWFSGAASCRAADRNWNVPGFRSDTLGFRPALVPSR
jgi:sulfatase modifying factor 1